MTAARKKRNDQIRKEIRTLQFMNYKIKNAIKIVAERYFLSSARVKDIWYGK